MKGLYFILAITLCGLFAKEESAIAASGERPIHEEVYFRCYVDSVTGQYTQLGSRYEARGICYTDNTVRWGWTAQGAYRTQGGQTSERIVFSAAGLTGGSVNVQMQCERDPWIGTSTCINPISQAIGEILYASNTLRGIQETIEYNRKPFATVLRASTGNSYDRGPLLAKRGRKGSGPVLT